MFDFSCTTDGCGEKASGWHQRCAFHEAVVAARQLSPEAYDRLRSTLADASPLTDEDRRVARVRATLRTLEWTSRDYKRAIDAAKAAGASDEQIVEALDALPVERPDSSANIAARAAAKAAAAAVLAER